MLPSWKRALGAERKSRVESTPPHLPVDAPQLVLPLPRKRLLNKQDRVVDSPHRLLADLDQPKSSTHTESPSRSLLLPRSDHLPVGQYQLLTPRLGT
jgi:hypothetical protein